MCVQRYECAELANLGVLRQEKTRQVFGFMLVLDEISIYQTDFQGSCPSYQLSGYHRAEVWNRVRAGLFRNLENTHNALDRHLEF
jgi:hypothetical protein